MDQSNKTTYLDWFQKKYFCFTIKDLNKALNNCSVKNKKYTKIWQLALWPFVALILSKKVCRGCLLVNYSLFNFVGEFVFNGGSKSPHCIPRVSCSGVIVNKPKPCPGFKYWLNVFLKKLNNFNSKNNYCYYCFSKQRQVIVDVKNTITAIVVA